MSAHDDTPQPTPYVVTVNGMNQLLFRMNASEALIHAVESYVNTFGAKDIVATWRIDHRFHRSAFKSDSVCLPANI